MFIIAYTFDLKTGSKRFATMAFINCFGYMFSNQNVFKVFLISRRDTKIVCACHGKSRTKYVSKCD